MVAEEKPTYKDYINKKLAGLVVEVKNVTKRFGEVVAVNNVSIDVHSGEFISLLGPSGCGKTTTLRIIGGFEYPDIGDVYISGRKVNNVSAHKRDTNMVFQQLALFPHLDVFDNVAFGLVMKKINTQEIKKRVLEILNLVELKGFEHRRINQLSGGQQQRVAIARALINQPSVLLLDEPLASLDLKLRVQMQLELKSIQKRVGTTFIYVTHDQGEALTMSDRIAVMNDGRIEQIGTSNEIYSQPATKFVANFIGDTNIIEGKVVSNDCTNLVMESSGIHITILNTGNIKGGNVIVSLRPERVKIGKQQNNDSLDNLFSARVINKIFFGSKLLYEVILDSGLHLRIETLHELGEVFNEGDLVVVGWSREAGTLLQ
jgi:spermidine/putrescine transport system ATP-binding protein